MNHRFVNRKIKGTSVTIHLFGSITKQLYIIGSRSLPVPWHPRLSLHEG
jgi:hypothetical protein